MSTRWKIDLTSPGRGSLNWIRPPGSILLERISLFQRHVAQIVAVQMQKIESDEIEVVLPACDGLSQFPEIGEPSIVQHNDFAVDNCAFRAKAGGLLHQVGVLRGPVMAVAGVDARAGLIDDELRAVAVELHLVNPSVALGRVLDQRRHQRRDELQTNAPNSRTAI